MLLRGWGRIGARKSRWLSGLHFACFLGYVACGLAVFLLFGAASASAYWPSKAEETEAETHEEYFIKRPGGIEETTEECSGESCHTGKSIVPPGWYLESKVAGFSAIRALEYGERECSNAVKDEGCKAFDNERPEKSAEYLSPGYKELYQVIESIHNYGAVHEEHSVWIYAWKPFEKESEWLGPENESEPTRKPCLLGYPVNCATGNQVDTQTDLTAGGRGLGLGLTRTYNSQLAAKQKEHGAFGYGWTGSYSAHLELGYEGKEATVYQDNGSTATFGRAKEGAVWTPASSLGEATLVDEGSGYAYTLPSQKKMYFNSEGKLTSESDRNGNTLTMSYESGHLVSVTDGAGRKLTFAYNSEGEVESAKDPMGHTVKYAYEGGDLTSVTQPAGSALRWQFKYNSEHELTSETDGRSHAVTTEYEAGRVSQQKDALGRERKWRYGGTELEPETTITEPNSSETVEHFNEIGEPTKVTHARGVSGLEATTEYAYNSSYELVKLTDPNKHVTEYGYDSAGNKTSEKNADGDETKWKYDATHDIETETTPEGETTTIKRNSHGDPEVIERPVGSETQKTTYKDASNGDVESMTNPLEQTWKYEYDSYGDRKAEIDPEGNKRTWEYNEDSQETATVSPRGNIEGAEAAKFRTRIERDALGRPLLVTGPEASGTSGPVNKAAPTIAGEARETQVLSAGAGVWEGSPSLVYSYQWQHCETTGGGCVNISGAISSTYTLASGDVGTTLKMVVTATNSWGTASSTSAATAVVTKVAALGAAHTPVFSMKFGTSGSGNGQFSRPRDVAVDSKGNVYVVDTKNNRVQEFSPSGEYIRQFGSEGTGNGQFKSPVGIAIAANGDLLVTDSLNDRVEVFSPTGEYISKFGSEGTGNGQFTEPVGIAIAPSGHILVTDARDYRVEVFSSTGEYIAKFGTYGSGNGQFFHPSGVAVDSSGEILIADTRNNRVQRLSSTGEYLGQFGSKGTGNGQFNEPVGIAVDPEEHVLVTDTKNGRVEVFAISGEYITQFGTKGSGSEQFGEPEGMTVDSKDDIWITDSTNNRTVEWKAAVSPSATETPSISGELLSGQTLSASTGTWTAIPNATYTYQWRRCNTSGGECSSITGATSSTYTLGNADIGSTLRVIVTATNSAGSSESTSAATEALPRAFATEYTYDANGNLASVTDPNGNKMTYTYDADNERTKTEEPNKTITETEYDSMGQMISQIDGNKHKTEYKRNALEEVTEEINPRERKTTKEYDAAGNPTKVTDPEKRTTTYTYDPANRLTEVVCSSGNPATIKYEYNKNGERTKMTDGTGTATYTYDTLGRLTESENGHKEIVKYEYNLANDPTKIKYPNSKEITRTYDKDARLETVTDWNSKVTKFAYNEDSELKATVFPSETNNEDTYAYNDADQMVEVKMKKSTETLASLTYTRDSDGQITTATSKGLPGEEKPSYEYDKNSRLTKGTGIAYEYDSANNPTKIGSNTYKYTSADELEGGGGTTYTYNEVGQRTKATPETGSATTYGYDQAGNLISVERPKAGETPAIEDTYAYDGEDLRASETINGTTSYLAWDVAKELPLLLSNGTYSFIYGPGNAPIEQINNTTGTTLYLHHDQQGSTRLLTGSTGTVTGKCTYSAYGSPTCEGTATTPLGYDAQYTSTDTGLIYLRARVYDPTTAQFLTVDPAVATTQAPYNYAGDNPLNESDPTGLLGWSEIGQAIGVGLVCVATDGAGCVAAGLADLDANVVSNDYEAIAHSCKAREEESSSLTDLAGFALGAGVGGLADGSLGEEAKKALESTSAGHAALKQLVGLGAGSSALTTLAYAQGHESSGSDCSCGG